MNDKKYVGGKKASEILGVHQRTLYQWEKKGKIETIRTAGGKRQYNVDKYLKDQIGSNEDDDNICKTKECELKLEEIKNKVNICYVRVSTHGQKDDLARQKEYMKKLYPKYEIIEDIGSGINFNRRGFRKIIELGIGGKIGEVVVAYKDRLARFGYDLIEDIINKYSDGKIIVINKKEEVEPEEELVKDVLQIMNVFTAKMNGLRKYKKRD